MVLVVRLYRYFIDNKDSKTETVTPTTRYSQLPKYRLITWLMGTRCPQSVEDFAIVL